MNLANPPWKLYLRLAVVVAVLLAALIVLVMNRTNYVRVWFFGLTSEQPVNVVWLMLSTALGTMTAWRVFAFSRGLWRDFRESANTPGLPVPAVKQVTIPSIQRPGDSAAQAGMEREKTAEAVLAKEMRP